MDPEFWSRVREVFEEIVELPEERRRARLFERAGPDGALREEVEALLESHESDGGFLSAPTGVGADAIGPEPRAPSRVPATEGARVGAYRLTRVLASGGMGTVYEAEQDEPRRTVALKMMGESVLTPSSQKRFKYESEILGLLRHPGIAQIYQAGIHVEGEGPRRREVPWFAMELVPGALGLTRYVRERGLSLERRLELFIEVCEAVHHGHQKGIVHRDLKPGNILVDESGRVKVIDFGVARATDSDIAATTLVTGSEEIAGTLQYMSPEQLEGDARSIDTRGDVYALGVVLYEVLCERLPYDLKGLPMPEAARAIREEVPRRPSQVDPRLHGDLEWIVLKALEKEPQRRYASADALAGDLERYLRHEPVTAHPPTVRYRVRRFARRNRALAIGVGVGGAAIVAALIVVSVIALRLRHLNRELEGAVAAERLESARAESVSRFFVQFLRNATPGLSVADSLGAVEAELELGSGLEPETLASLHFLTGSLFSALGESERARPRLEVALAQQIDLAGPDHRSVVNARREIAAVSVRLGDLERARRELELVERLEQPYVEAFPEDRLETLHWRALLESHAGSAELATETFEAVVEGWSALEGPGSRNVLQVQLDFAQHQLATRQLQRARETLEHVLARNAEREQPDPFIASTARARLSSVSLEAGDYDAAAESALAAWTEVSRVLGRRHPTTLGLRASYADVLMRMGRVAEATPHMETVHDELSDQLGDDHPSTMAAKANLGRVRFLAGRHDEARRLLEETHARRVELLGPRHSVVLVTKRLLALLDAERGRTGEAIEALREVASTFEETRGPRAYETLQARASLGWTLARSGAVEEGLRILASLREELDTLLAPDDPLALVADSDYAAALFMAGSHAEALELLEPTLERMREVLGEDAATTLMTASNVGMLLHELGRTDEARALLDDTLARQIDVHGEPHELVHNTLGNLTRIHLDTRSSDALGIQVRYARMQLALHGHAHPGTFQELSSAGLELAKAGELQDAADLFADAVISARATRPDDPWLAELCVAYRGSCLCSLGDLSQGKRLWIEGCDGLLHTGAPDEIVATQLAALTEQLELDGDTRAAYYRALLEERD